MSNLPECNCLIYLPLVGGPIDARSFHEEDTMWLIFLFMILLALAIGGGQWGSKRFGYWVWSPAAVILLAGALLVFKA
jgi:hypothetical protein